MHLAFLHVFQNLLDGQLTGLVLAFDGNDHPVVKDVKDLLGLAGDLVKDQDRPGEQEVQAHGEVLPLRVEDVEYFLVEREHVLLIEHSFDL